ncbi:MAG: HD domain-containing protein [Lentisphaeria bacterium]|nr:HD domain-containing protein [Lentisphaeria bacterium]
MARRSESELEMNFEEFFPEAAEIFDFFYPEDDALRRKLLRHSIQVFRKASALANETDVPLDYMVLEMGAILHDVGIRRCDAPGICCHGDQPYMRHGLAGAEMLRAYGKVHGRDLEPLARICERHTGSGLTAQEIEQQHLPLPAQDFLPETPEEKLICLADKFFSKSGDMEEKTFEQVRRSMAKFGPGPLARFDALMDHFGLLALGRTRIVGTCKVEGWKMEESPFAGLKIGWLGLDGVVSEIEDETGRRRLDWEQQRETRFCARDERGVFFLEFEKFAGGIRFRSWADLRGKLPEKLTFSPLVFPAVAVDHTLFCGEKMGRCQAAVFPVEAEPAFAGRHFAALTRKGETVLLTTPLNQQLDNFFRGQGTGKLLLDLRCDFEFRHNDVSGQVGFDEITLRRGDGIELLEAYGEANAEVKRDFSVRPECGWNSWDYYRWTVTEDEVIENAEFIAADPVLRKHVKRIIVDDGWQYCYGEWEANPLFPGGMKKLADRLRKLGFKPGLWLAPSIVEPHCRIAQWDSDMLALSEGGQPCLGFRCMERYGFLLDPTVPKSRKFLEELFDRCAGMGYGYFKLDFLAFTLAAGQFHDRSVPRCRILRLLMESICKGVAGRAEILGCNYPFGSGNSFVDAVRVGGDIHSHWRSIKTNTVSVAGMFWANKRLWLNDPDFSLCRGVETSEDPDLRRLKPSYVYCPPASAFNPACAFDLAGTTLDEQKVLLSLVIIAGGAVNLSDKMSRLNETGLELARKVVSAESGFGGRPLDLFEHVLPIYWSQRLKRGGRLLVVNWEDEEREIPAGPVAALCGDAELRDFWTGKTEKCTGSAALAPHSCKLWEY